jgi:hypothetical protein
MIGHMDEGIGAIVARSAARRARDTSSSSPSDNGGERFSDNWPLVGGKMDLTRAASACRGSRHGRRDRRPAAPARRRA